MSLMAFENPLISNARMRTMYRALVETRALGSNLGRGRRLPKGLEACWVGTGIDLSHSDFTSNSTGGALNDYIRAVGKREAAGAASVADVRGLLAAKAEPFVGTATDRLLCAVGAAMAVKRTKAGHIVMAYVNAGNLSKPDWKRVVAAGGRSNLPLILVVTPTKSSTSPSAPGIPVIPVDAGDAIALYRVAQESILRARSEGGMVVIDCVAMGADPVKILGRQLITKGIATERWIKNVEEHFCQTLARL